MRGADIHQRGSGGTRQVDDRVVADRRLGHAVHLVEHRRNLDRNVARVGLTRGVGAKIVCRRRIHEHSRRSGSSQAVRGNLRGADRGARHALDSDVGQGGADAQPVAGDRLAGDHGR